MINSLLSYKILNFNLITKDSEIIGVRGQTLSAPKKRWLLTKIKSAGINTIIDLRTGDQSVSFMAACEAAELKYFHCSKRAARSLWSYQGWQTAICGSIPKSR